MGVPGRELVIKAPKFLLLSFFRFFRRPRGGGGKEGGKGGKGKEEFSLHPPKITVTAKNSGQGYTT